MSPSVVKSLLGPTSSCNQWYHANCQSIHSHTYKVLSDSKANVSWHSLCLCNNPNYSATVHDMFSSEAGPGWKISKISKKTFWYNLGLVSCCCGTKCETHCHKCSKNWRIRVGLALYDNTLVEYGTRIKEEEAHSSGYFNIISIVCPSPNLNLGMTMSCPCPCPAHFLSIQLIRDIS